MSATEVGPSHSHVADLEASGLMCVCRACYLLFTHGKAGGGEVTDGLTPEDELGYAPWPMSWHTHLPGQLATAVDSVGLYAQRALLDGSPGRSRLRRPAYRAPSDLRTEFQCAMAQPPVTGRCPEAGRRAGRGHQGGASGRVACGPAVAGRGSPSRRSPARCARCGASGPAQRQQARS